MCGCWMDVGDGNDGMVDVVVDVVVDGMDVWCGMSSDT